MTKATRTVYHCGGGGIISTDEIDVESVELIGGDHDGRVIDLVNVLDDEVIIPGDQTCVYKRSDDRRFVFDHYR